MYRKVSYLLFFFAILIIFAMGPHSATTDEAIIIAQAEPDVYTIEELSLYNGVNNQPAYIVVDGVVYDVSNVEEWNNNLKQDYPSGQDVSEILKEDPLREIILEEAPEIGILQ